MAEVGIVLHQIDFGDPRPNSNFKGELWTPADGWAASWSDRWAASILNPQLRHTYYPAPHGGFVLAPAGLKLFCMYSSDGNSMNKVCDPLYGDGVKCIPGCLSPETRGQFCEDYHDGRMFSWTDCAFSPSHLADALRRQIENEPLRGRNNEAVIDMRSVSLPHQIEAFVIQVGPHGGGAAWRGSEQEAIMVAAHDRFVAQYFEGDYAAAPPLLLLDLESGGDAPFTPL